MALELLALCAVWVAYGSERPTPRTQREDLRRRRGQRCPSRLRIGFEVRPTDAPRVDRPGEFYSGGRMARPASPGVRLTGGPHQRSQPRTTRDGARRARADLFPRAPPPHQLASPSASGFCGRAFKETIDNYHMRSLQRFERGHKLPGIMLRPWEHPDRGRASYVPDVDTASKYSQPPLHAKVSWPNGLKLLADLRPTATWQFTFGHYGTTPALRHFLGGGAYFRCRQPTRHRV